MCQAYPALQPLAVLKLAFTMTVLTQARLACEDIVGPLQQQVELLPRAQSVIQVSLLTVYAAVLGCY